MDSTENQLINKYDTFGEELTLRLDVLTSCFDSIQLRL